MTTKHCVGELFIVEVKNSGEVLFVNDYFQKKTGLENDDVLVNVGLQDLLIKNPKKN